MKKFIQKMENTFAAVAFAEEGEFETAQEILNEDQSIAGKVTMLKHDVDLTIDNLTAMAIAFAEDGEFETAREILQEVETKLKTAKDDLKGKLINFYEKYA
jgi:cellobiose-specific phosphotransferase system component IIA